MNNIESFYKRKRILDSVKQHSHLNSTFFFRVHTSGDQNAVRIVLEKQLVEALECNEKMELLEIIQAGLIGRDKRIEIEDHLLESLEKSLETSRKQVAEDLQLPSGKEE